MKAVFSCLRWSLRAWRRRVFARPSTAAALMIGLPFIFLAYASFGSSIGDYLTASFASGPDAFADAATLCARFYTAFVLILAGGTVLGNFYVEGQRRTFQRLLSYPLESRELYGVLLSFELAQAFVFLVPFVGLLAVKLALAGVPWSSIVCLAFFPFSTVACAVFACRIATIGALSIVPRSLMSWRLPFLAIALSLPYVARAAGSFLRGGEQGGFLLTDWPGRGVAGLLENVGWVAPIIFGVGLPIALGLTDYLFFRRVLLTHYDSILGKLRRSGLSSLGTGWVGPALDRAPERLFGVPFRGALKRETLRVTRDATLSLAVLFPVATIGLIVVLVEFLLGFQLDAVIAATPIEMMALGVAALTMLGGILLPGISVPWEGERLGPVRMTPFSAAAVLRQKALANAVLTFGCWAGAWTIVAVVPLTRNALPPLVLWVVVPLAITLSAWPVARIGTAIGAIFPRVDASTPLLKMGLIGVGVLSGFSTLTLLSLTGAVLMPFSIHVRFIWMSLFIVAVWWIVKSFIVREGERALRATRIEE